MGGLAEQTCSIQACRVGAAKARNIMAATDYGQTDDLYIRIDQRCTTCIVDAFAAKHACAMRTWRSGQSTYEPLVSGRNLLGVWEFLEDYPKTGF